MFEEEKEENLGSSREACFHFSGPSNDIWKRFYDPASIDTHVTTSRTVTENKHVFVDYILFEDFSPNGVINISNPNADTKVLCSTSSFFKCSSSDSGGSIYLYESGSFVQYKVCSYESKSPLSNGAGSHSYIWVTNDDNHKNFVIESSFTQNTGEQSVFWHSSGSILFSSINISDSKLDVNAAFVSWELFSLSTTNFSNFDNLSSNKQCCFFHSSKKQNFLSLIHI